IGGGIAGGIGGEAGGDGGMGAGPVVGSEEHAGDRGCVVAERPRPWRFRRKPQEPDGVKICAVIVPAKPPSFRLRSAARNFISSPPAIFDESVLSGPPISVISDIGQYCCLI